jgi:amidase
MELMLDAHPVEDGVAYMKALAERSRLVREWQRFFESIPLVLGPISTQPVYVRGFDLDSVDRTAALWRECATLMAVPVLGVPGLAVPTGVSDGLPTGVQVVAPRFREDLCLAAAEVIEARSGMATRTPIDIV